MTIEFWFFTISALKQSGFYLFLVHLKSNIYNDREKKKNCHGYILQAGLQWPAEYFRKFIAVVSHLSNGEHSTKCSRSFH